MIPDWPRALSDDNMTCNDTFWTVSLNRYASTMRRCTSCIPCPVWTRVDYAVDAFQENRIYGVRREYVYYSTIPPRIHVGADCGRTRSVTISKCLILTVRNVISSNELTKVSFDFLHTFHDVENALSMHTNSKVTVVYPAHANKRCLLDTTCCKTNANELHVVIQHDHQWMFRRLI